MKSLLTFLILLASNLIAAKLIAATGVPKIFNEANVKHINVESLDFFNAFRYTLVACIQTAREDVLFDFEIANERSRKVVIGQNFLGLNEVIIK